MPNIRIKDIPTTASATVNGDFFAVDSSASTRKLNAFSPAFGGQILAADGTAAAPSLSFSNDTNTGFYKVGAATDVLYFGANGAASLRYTTNGSIYGGTNNSYLQINPTSDIYASVDSSSNGSIILEPKGTGNVVIRNLNGIGTRTRLEIAQTGLRVYHMEVTATGADFAFGDGGGEYFRLSASTYQTLFGTNVNSNNGRIQLATHTANTGGIGFGSDISLYRDSTFGIALRAESGTSTLRFFEGITYAGQIGTSNGNMYFDCLQAAKSSFFRTNGGVIALTLDPSQNATFAKDILLGTNGPSVPSTLSGRAPRQGLVFDGSAAATASAVGAIGSGDYTVHVVFKAVSPTSPLRLVQVGQAGVPQGFQFGTTDSAPAGRLVVRNGDATAQLFGSTILTADKWYAATAVRSSGTTTIYLNAIIDASGTLATNYSSGIGGLTIHGSTGNYAGTVETVLVYNRALSAAEVKALYETGVPAAEELGVAGSIAPSNTTLTTSAVAQNFAYDTFSSTTNSFSAVETGGQACEANFISGTTFLGKAPRGARFLVSFTATLTSGATPSVRLSTQAVAGTSSAIVNVVNGSNSIILQLIEPFTAETGTGAGRVTFATGSNTNYSISNLVVTRLGTVLAPDATQTGGGLTWYDTSGNGANITLPASGVAWNVPFNGRIQFGDGTGALPSITFSGATNTGFSRNGSGHIAISQGGNSVFTAYYASGGVLGSAGGAYLQLAAAGAITLACAGTDQSVLLSASGQGAMVTQATNTIFRSQSGASEWARFNNSGTFLLGTATDSSNGRLQLATHTAATGGIGFGADVTLYRSAADTLRTDDAFIIQRDINQEFFGFNVANANTGTSALVTASVSNGAYGAGFTMGGQNFTNTSFLRGNRLALTGPFDINYVSAQHFFWIGGGGAGTSTAGSQLVFSLGLGAKITHSPISFSTSSWLTNGAIAEFSGSTVTNNSTAASGTAASAVAYSFAVPSFAATNASVTTTNAATLYVAGNPTASTNQTFTNAWGIWNAGRTKLGGFVRIDDSSTSSSKDTGCLVVEGGIGVEENVNVGGFYGLVDGVTAPATGAGYARIYIDSADGDLKIKFSDGTVKTIVTDT